MGHTPFALSLLHKEDAHFEKRRGTYPCFILGCIFFLRSCFSSTDVKERQREEYALSHMKSFFDHFPVSVEIPASHKMSKN